MYLYPAIDLYKGEAVRLMHGKYDQMTVYAKEPLKVAKHFEECGAKKIHIVDLEGARDGTAANYDTIAAILQETSLEAEIGGGIRSMDVMEKYLTAGAQRIILGTAAITDPAFLSDCVKQFGEHIAVGVDVRDGFVAIKGWTEVSNRECFDFCREMEQIGVGTVICTDISKDGALSGTNLGLYEKLSRELSINIIASGGITTVEDLRSLARMKLYGAIVGRVLYTGDMSVPDALSAVRNPG